MKKTSFLVVLFLFAGTACWPFSEDSSLSPMTLQRDSGSGRIEVTRGDEVIPVSDEIAIEPLDVIVTSKNAEAKLRLEGKRVVEIAPQSQVKIMGESSVDSLRGRLLVNAGDQTTVSFGGVEAASADAVFRIDRGYAFTRSGVYDGEVQLTAPGRPRLTVGSLFQTSVAAGTLQAPVPYQLDPKSEWDQVHLRDVLDLDEEISDLSSGLAKQIGRVRPDVDYFRGLAGGNRVGFVRAYLNRRADDLLVGFTIAQNTPEFSLGRGFKRAFSLFDEGARWSIVAAILEARFGSLVSDLAEAIVDTGIVAASGSGGEADFTLASSAAGEPGTTGTPSGSTEGSGGGEGGGDNDPEPKPKPSPTDDCESYAECQLQDLLPSPSPSPTDLTDGLISG